MGKHKDKQESLSEQEKKIVSALDSPDYRWRTIEGLCKETKLNKEDLINLLEELGEKGYMLKIANPNGDGYLYTTPNNYTKKHNFFEITLSAATGSIVY